MDAEHDEEAETLSRWEAEDLANSRQQEAESEIQAEASHAEAAQEVAAPVQAGRILGVSRRFYPMQASVNGKPMIFAAVDQSDDPPATVCVLVAGAINDYAAYIGHGTPEWVRDHGDKIRFEEACCHFPGGQLQRERYRS